MIAANGATARFLVKHKLPSIRRVVRSPERWDRIEKIAEERGERLPPGAGCEGARGVPAQHAQSRSDALSRSLAVDREG